ncbi:hypothetical protein V5D56_05205 [Cellulosimicrobium sp. PMB13]|uniref:hypothetical protein n=1 Tax=Cellulosimicrobium sp. PMB13 TaxID=3120158 RepID=UPI003F4AFD4C
MRTAGGARAGAALLGAAVLTVGLSAALAGPAAAADRSTGHFDVAAEIECDANGDVTDVHAHVHEHVGGAHLELPAGDWLAFTSGGSVGPAVGFAVEEGATCDLSEVEFSANALESSSTGSSLSASGLAGSFSASATAASGAVALSPGGHEDVAWTFAATGTYVITFDVSVDGVPWATSEELPLKSS